MTIPRQATDCRTEHVPNMCATIPGKTIRRLACILLAFCTLAATAADQQPWKFMVTCDSRGSDDGVNQVILAELAEEALRQKVDFVLFCGDLVSGSAATGPAQFESQLRTWTDLMAPVYDANIPVYVSRGNHEIGDNWGPFPPPEFDPNDNFATRWLDVFASDSDPTRRLPANGPPAEKHMTYSIAHKNAFIVVLDQYGGMRHSLEHRINQPWLDAQLTANTKPHVFVTGHEPAFKAMHDDCLDDYPLQRDQFWAALRNAAARVYLSGHDHFYDHAVVHDADADPQNDIHQYIIGTAGAVFYTWSPPYSGSNSLYTLEQIHHARAYGYVIAEVNDLDVTLTWTRRDTNQPHRPGVYEPNELWQYTVTPRCVLLSPNGRENLLAEQSHTIAWKTIDGAPAEQVTIDFSPDNGQTWTCVDTVDNSGLYPWNVPLVDSQNCLVRISDSQAPNINDVSDETFAILPCKTHFTGDLNADCRVDFADLAALLADWLKSADPNDPSQ